MAFWSLSPRDVGHVAAPIPRAGLVTSTILSMITLAVLAICMTRRVQATRNWGKIPLTRWILFAVYADSISFTLISAVLEHGYGLNETLSVCQASIIICLICYLSTKLIYYFLVEKVYIIRRVHTPRLKSKLYIFNTFGLLLTYVIIIILNFVYRTAFFNDNGVCIIGMQAHAVLPLILYDALVNFYLTLLFVIPLRSLYSYKNHPNSILRTVALRSFAGSLGTLTSSVVNLTILMVLHGEAAWICLMCCNADVLFSVLVLHWVTSKDSSSTSSTGNSDPHTNSRSQINTKTGTHGSRVGRDRLGSFGVYGNGKGAEKGMVTTHISARDVKLGAEDDEEVIFGKDDGDIGAGGHPSEGWQLGRIKVKVGQVVEVEHEPRSRSEEGSSTGGEEGRGRVSTEDLFVR